MIGKVHVGNAGCLIVLFCHIYMLDNLCTQGMSSEFNYSKI